MYQNIKSRFSQLFSSNSLLIIGSEFVEESKLSSISFNPQNQKSFIDKFKNNLDLDALEKFTPNVLEKINQEQLKITNNHFNQNTSPFNISTMNINIYPKTCNQVQFPLIENQNKVDVTAPPIMNNTSNLSNTDTFCRVNTQKLEIKEKKKVPSSTNFLTEGQKQIAKKPGNYKVFNVVKSFKQEKKQNSINFTNKFQRITSIGNSQK